MVIALHNPSIKVYSDSDGLKQTAMLCMKCESNDFQWFILLMLSKDLVLTFHAGRETSFLTLPISTFAAFDERSNDTEQVSWIL